MYFYKINNLKIFHPTLTLACFVFFVTHFEEKAFMVMELRPPALSKPSLIFNQCLLHLFVCFYFKFRILILIICVLETCNQGMAAHSSPHLTGHTRANRWLCCLGSPFVFSRHGCEVCVSSSEAWGCPPRGGHTVGASSLTLGVLETIHDPHNITGIHPCTRKRHGEAIATGSAHVSKASVL